MDVDSIEEIVKDLTETAATISSKSSDDLQIMKRELDEYVENIISQMPEQAKDTMNIEFEKCKVCAHDWICVYNDTEYNAAVKDDILKEEVMEFFFSMNEKIVAVQKNFFLLGMVDELLNPAPPFSQTKRKEKINKSRIRMLAREQGYTASYKYQTNALKQDSPEQRLWFFGDDMNFLQSSDEGLSDAEALDYLLD